MTYMYAPTGKADTQKITFSTWVYIPKSSIDQASKDAQTLDVHAAPGSTHRRIPIMEIGSSIEPRVGAHVGMALEWQGYLCVGLWFGSLDAPDPFFATSANYWINSEINAGPYGADTHTAFVKDQWSQFDNLGLMQCEPAPTYDFHGTAWDHARIVLFNGEEVASFCSCFYNLITYNYVPPPLNLIPTYNGFKDDGIAPFMVSNNGAPMPNSPSSNTMQPPMSWTWPGDAYLVQIAIDPSGRVSTDPTNTIGNKPRVSVQTGDVAGPGGSPPASQNAIGEGGTILANSQVFFTNFWSDPKNGTMQATPTRGPDAYNLIRVETQQAPFHNGEYFAFGDLIVYFPKRKGINYGEPANPSTLYLEGGNVVFELAGRWPHKNFVTDKEIVPTLKFTLGGFVPDSWNHIFFSCDLTTIGFSGGNIDQERDSKEQLQRVQSANVKITQVYPPDMTTAPRCGWVVNGVRTIGTVANIETKLCTYMDQTNFVMQLDGNVKDPAEQGTSLQTTSGAALSGMIGFPIIPQEWDRWKMTGKNQKICYAYTHIWLDQYIEPTDKNLKFFFRKSKNKNFNYVVPPPNKFAAIKEFGKPDVWCYRDKNANVQFDHNGNGRTNGKLGRFTVVGPDVPSSPPPKPADLKLKDFRPGPGQTVRKPPMTT